MSDNHQPEYKSLWDIVSGWEKQGWSGKFKLAAWVIFVIILFLLLLPSLLWPIYKSSSAGEIIAISLYILVVVIVQRLGTKLKIEVKK